MKKIDFSFVLPAYNEEKNIRKAVEQASRFLAKRFKSWEIIVVNDGSADRTLEEINDIAKTNKFLEIVNHKRNRGYGAAVWNGLKAARGELVFFTDSDLQFDLKDLQSFLGSIKECDVVIGYRVRRVEGLKRKINVIGWKLACYLALGIKFRDIDCAFKLFKKESLEKIRIFSRGATFSAELLFRLKEKGCKIIEMPVKHLPRLHGKPTGSKISVILRAFSELYRLFMKTPRMVDSRARWFGFFAIIALFLSRFLFLSNSKDFFDSSEYLWRLKIPEMIKVLTSGHPPFHPMYVGLSSLFYKFGVTAYEGVTAGIIPSALFGSLGVVFMYLLAKNLFGRRIAYLSATIFALLPFVYSGHIGILVDPTMHGFYFASLYFFALSCKERGAKGLYLAALSGILLGGAAFTHTSIAFWVSAYVGIWLLKIEMFDLKTVKRDIFKFVLIAALAMWAIAGYVWLLRIAYEMGIPDGKPTIAAALRYLLLGNVSDRSPISLYLSLKYYLTISTVLVALLAVLGWFKLLFLKTKTAIAFFIWFVPSALLTANYIYENLHGRAMIPALAPTAILCAWLIFSIKKPVIKALLTVLVLAQVIFLGFSVAAKYKVMPAPFEQIYLMQRELKQGGVFISSNVSRTFNEYKGQFISFGDVGQGANEAEKAISDKLKNAEPAYVTLDAIQYPRRRFDGEYFDIRANAAGKPKNQRTLLNNVFEEYTLKLAKMNSDFPQAVYEISKDDSSRMSELDSRSREHKFIFGRILKNDAPAKVVSVNVFNRNFCMSDRADITYGDFGFCFYRILAGNRDIENWSYTDREGWFYVPVSSMPDQILIGYSAEQSKIPGDEYFVKTGEQRLKGEWIGTFSLKELEQRAVSLKSFYAVSTLDGDQVKYELFALLASFEGSNRIQGEDLVSEVGKTVEKGGADGGFVVSANHAKSGYLVSGPYINLDKGKYKVDFEVIEKEGSYVVDVISDLGRNELSRKEIQISSTGSKKETLEFEIPTEQAGKNVEFRIRLKDAALELDYIELTRL